MRYTRQQRKALEKENRQRHLWILPPETEKHLSVGWRRHRMRF